MNAHSYNIIVRYVVAEECYEAKVLELPDTAEYADTYQEAYELAIDTIEATAAAMEEKGKKMPTPHIPAESDYSGRVTLRLPKSLHAAMVHISEQEETSLNQMICSIVAAYRGFDGAMQKTMEDWITIPPNTPSRSSKANRLRVISTTTPNAREASAPDTRDGWGKSAVGA